MDEVEHRRRRTRSGRSTDHPYDRQDGADVAGEPAARAVGVTPADIAERATSAPSDSPLESPTTELPTVRARTRPERGADDRHLPFDAHTAHPINEERDGERGLRGLIGSGATQVSVSAAMRARDAARPTEAELVEAEATLTIVHRGWVPRDVAGS